MIFIINTVEYRRMEPLRLSHLLNSSAVMCNPDYMKRNDVSFEMRVANSDNERRQKSIQVIFLSIFVCLRVIFI